MNAFVLFKKVEVLASELNFRAHTEIDISEYIFVNIIYWDNTRHATSQDHRIDVPGPQQSCHLLDHFIPRVSI